MSSTIDNRVVEMRFDNKHFENNVATSIGTLDKLKKSLKLDGASKSLQGLTSAAKKVDISSVGKSAETVGLKFNAMYTMADQALRNITNSAINAGKRIVSALTIDPVKTGFDEYETKIGSIQTIMSNTASKGTTMADVTRVIDELNTYADKTIYNFAEMTRNIGTFTAAGVGLEESAAAIQGIANLAASSGSTSQQASTAMYQLSQALAAGTVKLMDWNSVVNAGMGGEKFQEALKATARDHGIAVDEMIEKSGSFRESLSDGWITADILNETLNKFTIDGAKNYAQSMIDSGKWTEQQGEALIEEAKAMDEAATKVKTFTQLWDTMKESVQSGWGKTWELIIGDFEEAKELWSGVSKTLSGMIDKFSNARNDVLEGALTSNWDKLIKRINEAGIETKTFEDAVKRTAKENGYNTDRLVKNYGSLEKAFQSGAIKADILNQALDKITGTSQGLSDVTRELSNGMKGDDVKKIEDALLSLGYSLTGKDGKFYGDDGYFGTLTREAIKEFQKIEGLEITGIVDEKTLAALDKATSKAGNFSGSVKDLIDDIDNLGGRAKIIEAFKNIFQGISNIASPLGKVIKGLFPKITAEGLYSFIDGFRKLTERFNNFTKSAESQTVITALTTAFNGLLGVVKLGAGALKGLGSIALGLLSSAFINLGSLIVAFAARLGESLIAVKDWIVGTGFIPAAVDLISTKIQNGITFIKNFAKTAKESAKTFLDGYGGLGGVFTSIFGTPLALAVTKLGEFIGRFKDIKKFDSNTLKGVFEDFRTNVIEHFTKINPKDLFNNFVNGIKSFAASAKKYFGEIGGKFGETIEKLGAFGKAVKDNIVNNLGGLAALGALVGFFITVGKIKDAIETLVKPLDFLDDFGDGMKKLGNAVKFSVKATAIKNIAISIAILAGSLAVLAMIPSDRLKAAVISLGVVAAALTGVIIALSKVSDNMGDLAKMSLGILAMAGSVMIFAIACKMLSRIDDGAIGKCVILIGGFVGIVALMQKATGKIGATYIAAFGKMMMRLAGALLIFSVAIGILGRMDLGTLVQGGAAIGVFLLMMAGMMKATRHLGKDLPKFATTMNGLAAALLLFTVVVGILGNMDLGTLLKGGAAIGVFLFMMVGVMKATKTIGKDLPQFGATMFGLSAGILALAVTARIIASINTGDLIKGGIVIGAFMFAMVKMMEASTKLTKHSANAGKIGLMMLSFAGAMVLLTGAIAILSLIKVGDLAKAIGAIAAVSAIFGGLIAITKFAKVGKGVKTTIIAMAAAIGVLAISIAALSLIDSDKLAGATAAMASIVGVFALLVASTKLMAIGGLKSIVMLIALVGAVVLLGETIRRLTDVPADAALSVSKALSRLLISLSASCVLLAAVGAIGPAAFVGIGVLAALMAVVGLFAGIAIASLPAIGKKLAEFAEASKPFFDIVSTINSDVGTGMKNLASAMSILTKSALLDKVASFGKESSLATFGENMAAFGESLSKFLQTVSSPIDADGNKVEINFDNVTKSLEQAIKLSEIAGTLPTTSGLSTKISKTDLGEFGDQIATFADGLNKFLTKTSDPFSELDNKGDKAPKSKLDYKNVEKAVEIGSDLADLSMRIKPTSGIANFWSKTDLGEFGSQVGVFASGLSSFISRLGSPYTELKATMTENGVQFTESEVDIDLKQVESAVGFAEKLAGVASTIPPTSGMTTWFEDKNLVDFGAQVSGFASGLKSFMTKVGTPFTQLKTVMTDSGAEFVESEVQVDIKQIESAMDFAQKLADLSGDIPATGGFSTKFVDKNLIDFGAQAAGFASGLKTFMTTIGTPFTELTATMTSEGKLLTTESEVNVDYGQITKAIDFAERLAGVAESIPETSWWNEKFSGEKDLAGFGYHVSTFASGLKTFMTTIGTPFTELTATMTSEGKLLTSSKEVNVEYDQITKAIEFAEKLAGVAEKVPESSKWKEWFSGEKDLGGFGTQVGTFASGLKDFMTTMGSIGLDVNGNKIEIDTTLVDSAIGAAEKLAGIGGQISEGTAGWDWLTGKDSLGDFATNIKELGGGLSEFSGKVSGEDFNIESVTAAITEISRLAGIASTIVLNESAGSLTTLGNEITNLSYDLNLFYQDISGIDAGKISSIATALTNLASIETTNADALQSFINSLGSVGTDGVKQFVDAMSTSGSKVQAEAANLMLKAIKGITSKKRLFDSTFKGVLTTAVSTIRGFHSQFVSAGGHLATGFALGIISKMAFVIASAVAIAKAAKAAVETTLGIKSPSRVMMKAGGYTTEGFAIGITKGASSVVNAATMTAEYAKKGFTDALSHVSDLITMGIDDQPTIRPVLDLSDVSAGVNRIGGMLGGSHSMGLVANVNGINSMMNRRQNGTNYDVVSAIKDLGARMGESGNNYSYSINGVSYNDGSDVSDAIRTLVRAAGVERRT